MNKKMLSVYLNRHRIKCIDYNEKKVHPGKKYKVGTERKKSDGYTLVKVAEPDVWKNKQRVIYENYYNIKLDSDTFVIFLDGNKDNFNIDNLKAITRQESLIAKNQSLFSKNKEVTEVGLYIAKLYANVNEKNKLLEVMNNE